jgi:hypothetical protein
MLASPRKMSDLGTCSMDRKILWRWKEEFVCIWSCERHPTLVRGFEMTNMWGFDRVGVGFVLEISVRAMMESGRNYTL